MIPINLDDIILELIKLHNFSPFQIEVNKFNSFAQRLRSRNVNCRYSYYDLEDYAQRMPTIARIENTKIAFAPHNLVHMTKICEQNQVGSCVSIAIVESWEK